ncbi:MAG: OmpH family outer membrane protein [Bacteroidota bacterium]
MKQIKQALIALIFVLGLNQVNAQSKIAHVNSQDLIESMDAYKEAMDEMDKIEKTYRAQLEDMYKEAEKTNERYQSEAGSKTEEENQRRAAKLQEMQNSIMEYSQTAQEELQKKRESLIRPILERAREIIQQVAREKGYDYVLDSSTGTGVLMADGDDLIEAVKAEINK